VRGLKIRMKKQVCITMKEHKKCQKVVKAYEEYEDRKSWSKKMLVNIAKAGYFSSDRTIADYNKDIWHLQ